MKKNINILLYLLLLTASCKVNAQNKSPEQFIPQGWKLIMKETGDLNKDKLDDLVMVIEENNKDNLIPNERLGEDTLNLNPRTILVLFKQKNGGYYLVSKNDKGFAPTQHDVENPCLADPLLIEGHIGIEKGILIINYNYWLSCGSWYVNKAEYKFRFQNNAMELIGFDHHEFHRATGDASSTSINFSTKKIEETTGLNNFEDTQSNKKTQWHTFHFPKLLRLQDLDENTYFKIMDL